MAVARFVVILVLSLAMTLFTTFAADPSMLQDYCVGTTDPNNQLFVNGFFCKNPMEVTADDFLYKSINVSRSFNYKMGVNGTLVTAALLPGLNTMGLAMGHIVYGPKGLMPLHIHPRASEVLTVVKGTLYVGFLNGANKLFTKVLYAGDMFVFPQGLVNFSLNLDDTNTYAILAYNSQNPGFSPLNLQVFGSHPSIPADILSKAFQLDATTIQGIQAEFS